MNVTFTETMAGTFVATDGRQAPMIFEVDAQAPGPTAFLTGGPIVLTGTVTIGGLARTAALTGTLVVQLLRLSKRELVYDFEFNDDEGRPCRYEARKNVSLLRPLATMTTLEGLVYRENESIGSATVHFDLRDIPGFLSSFGLGKRTP